MKPDDVSEQYAMFCKAVEKSRKMLAEGYGVRMDVMLSDAVEALYNALSRTDISETDKIAAAGALANILISPNFPLHWFHAETQT